MSETQTAERIDEENLVDVAARAAEEAQAKTLATIRPEQQRWDEHQTAILRQLGLEDATQGDLDLFFHVCRTTGLDPFRKQIYMIGRNTKITEWVDQPSGGRTKIEKWVTKYTIQTGIDGFRRNGREAAKQLGDTISFDGPYWCGDDGQWREVWPAATAPTAAKFTIFRNGEPFSAVVHYDEFVQTNNIYEGIGRDRKVIGQEPNSMWAKMPRNQTAKCAEAMAWRRAYPDDFAGLILEDAAQPTVIDQHGNIEQEPQRRRPAGAGVDGMREARERREAQRQQQDTTVIDAEPADLESADVEPESGGKPMAPQTRKKWLNRMFQLLNDGDCPDRDDQIIVITGTAAAAGYKGLVLDHRDDLTDETLRVVVTQLNDWDKANQLGHEITELLNRASIAQMEAEAAAAEETSNAASENAEADLTRREAEAEAEAEDAAE